MVAAVRGKREPRTTYGPSRTGFCRMKGKPARSDGKCIHIRILGCGSCFDQAFCACYRLVDQAGECQRENSTCPDVNVVVAATFELSAAHFGPSLRLPRRKVCRAKPGFH